MANEMLKRRADAAAQLNDERQARQDQLDAAEDERQEEFDRSQAGADAEEPPEAGFHPIAGSAADIPDFTDDPATWPRSPRQPAGRGVSPPTLAASPKPPAQPAQPPDDPATWAPATPAIDYSVLAAPPAALMRRFEAGHRLMATAAGGLKAYLNESVAELRQIPADVMTGMKETLSEIGHGYIEGATGHVGPNAAVQGLWGAAKGALTSPAAEFLNDLFLSQGLASPELYGTALLKSGKMARLASGGGSPEVIGGLPKAEDFRKAAENIIAQAAANRTVGPDVEKRLLKLWTEDGVHPAEVAEIPDIAAPTERGFSEWRMGRGLGMDLSPLPENPLVPPRLGFNPAGAGTSVVPIASAAGKRGAEAIISQRMGLAARRAAQEIDSLSKSQGDFAKLSSADRTAFASYAAGRSEGAVLPARLTHLQEAADTIKWAYGEVLHDWQNTKAGEKAIEKGEGLEGYLRNEVWDELSPKQQVFVAEGSARGAEAKREFLTFEDLLRADPEARFNDNFIEQTMKYVFHARRDIAMNEVLDAAKEQDVVRYSTQPLPGMVALEGRVASAKGVAAQFGGRHYANVDFAKTWNAFVSEGFSGKAKTLLEMTLEASNFTNRIKLFGLYHPFTVTLSSISSPVADAIDNLAYGKPWAAIKSVAKAPVAPLWHLYQGSKGTAEYLHPGRYPELSQIIDGLSQANFNPSAIDRSISITAQGSLYSAWRKGILGAQMRVLDESVITQETHGAAMLASARAGANLTGRALETLTAPIFNFFIPRIKTGAAIETYAAWLKAHPFVTHDEALVQTRQIQKTMDDRFGEMNMDTVFWDKKTKQSLQAALLSATWGYGFLRSSGQGLAGIGSVAAKRLTGGRIAPDAEWTRQASYLIAWPAVAILGNIIYQYAKTGKAPESFEDLILPQTGVNRALLPGHMKDLLEALRVLSGSANAIEILGGKGNPFLTAVWHIAHGKDWKEEPLADPGANILLRWAERLNAGAQEATTPIFMSGAPNPDLGPVEKFIGVKKVGQENRAFMEDPLAGITGKPIGTFINNEERINYYRSRRTLLRQHEQEGTATPEERAEVARLKRELPKRHK